MTQHRSTGRHRPLGFTLIELLVVISIVALLIALLMPALNKARLVTQSVKCQSNLRQITLASFSYAVDAKNNLPVKYPHAGADIPVHGVMPFVANIEPYYVKSGASNLPHTPSRPNPAWACPSSRLYAGTAVSTSNRLYLTTYSANVALGTDSTNPLERRAEVTPSSEILKWYPTLDEIAIQSKTVLYGEGTGRFTGSGQATHGYTRPGFGTFTRMHSGQNVNAYYSSVADLEAAPIPSSGLYTIRYGAGYWHGGMEVTVASAHELRYSPSAWGNFSWADGHVSSLKPTEGKDGWLVRGAHPLKK